MRDNKNLRISVRDDENLEKIKKIKNVTRFQLAMTKIKKKTHKNQECHQSESVS